MAPVLKTGIPGRVSGVRIPHSPPLLSYSAVLRGVLPRSKWPMWCRASGAEESLEWFSDPTILRAQLDYSRAAENLRTVLHYETKPEPAQGTTSLVTP